MNKLKDFIDSFENIYIYGAGWYGKLAYRMVEDLGKKVSGFIVSDDKALCGMERPMYHISNWEKIIDKSMSGIVVAVSERYIEEITYILKQLNFENYYTIDKDDLFWMETIGIMDTTISDYNHGNQIIMDSVRKKFAESIHNKFIIDLPCWDDLKGHALEAVNNCQYLITGGTNLISGNMEKISFIGITRENMESFKGKVVLMGAGWADRKYDWTNYSKYIFSYVLSKEFFHSVRDEYTKQKLNEIGIHNVINTGCPTLWDITEEHCSHIPKSKGKSALIMVSGSNIDIDISKIVIKYYTNIYAWVQQPSDYLFIRQLYPQAKIIGWSLKELDAFLADKQDIDYIGTRLHGGIRCIQNQKRSIIFSIDYRAKEMRKDFNLPVVDEIDILAEKICIPFETKIKMPFEDIKKWVEQFM